MQDSLWTLFYSSSLLIFETIASFHCFAFSDFSSVSILSFADIVYTQVISCHYVMIKPKFLSPHKRGDMEP